MPVMMPTQGPNRIPGHDGDHPYVNQRAFDIDARIGTEQGEQREDGRDCGQFQRSMIFLLQQLAKQPGAGEEKQADQHQGGTIEYR